MPKKENETKTAASAQPKKPVKPAKKSPAAAGRKSPARKRKPVAANAPVPAPAAQAPEECFARWVGKDFLRTEDEKLLYYLGAAGSVAMVFWGWRDGNFLSMLTFLLLLVVIGLALRSQARDVAYEINLDGIVIGNQLYPFEEIRSFEVTKKDRFDVIKIQLKTTLFPVRELHLHAEQDIVFIRNLLKYFLPEERQQETLLSFKSKKAFSEKDYIDEKVDEFLKRKL